MVGRRLGGSRRSLQSEADLWKHKVSIAVCLLECAGLEAIASWHEPQIECCLECVRNALALYWERVTCFTLKISSGIDTASVVSACHLLAAGRLSGGA